MVLCYGFTLWPIFLPQLWKTKEKSLKRLYTQIKEATHLESLKIQMFLLVSNCSQ